MKNQLFVQSSLPSILCFVNLYMRNTVDDDHDSDFYLQNKFLPSCDYTATTVVETTHPSKWIVGRTARTIIMPPLWTWLHCHTLKLVKVYLLHVLPVYKTCGEHMKSHYCSIK